MTALRVCAVLLALLLTGCDAIPATTPAATLTPSPSAIPPASSTPVIELPTLFPTIPPTETPADVSSAPCAYAWAYQEAPGVPERARRALESAGLAPSNVSAQVYGENCVNADGSVRQFLPMGTTITAELPVADLADQAALADLVVQITAVLSEIGETPGPEPEARLIFAAGDETRALRYTLRAARSQIEAGHTGADLLALLGYQP